MVYGPLETVPRYTLYPVIEDELGDHDSATLCCTGVAAAPVPVAVSVTGEVDALEVKETLAVVAPVACGSNVRVNDAVPPAAMVSGRDGPVNENSVPLLTAAAVTFTLAPVALSVTGRLLLVFTVTLPKLKLVGLTLNWPVAVAVPDSAMDGDVASETRAMAPLAAPGVVGVKVTSKVKAWPAVRVSGMLSPLIPNCDPVKVALETVRLDPPVFVKVAVCVLELPTCTLPKLTGFTLRIPEVMPVPERGMVRVEAGLLVVTTRFTLLLTADCGAKTTLNDVDPPAARVWGKLRPVTVYPAPAAACVTVMLDPPELVSVSGRLLLLPTVMLPKLKLGALADSAPELTALPETAAVSVGLEALLLMESSKLSVPADCGAKTTLNGALCPAAKLSGRVRPLMLYPAPLKVA